MTILEEVIKEIKDFNTSNIILAFVTCFLVIVGVVLLYNKAYEYTSKQLYVQWNNGNCIKDNGNMELFSTVSDRYHIYYVYKCDTCGHSETFNRSMK